MRFKTQLSKVLCLLVTVILHFAKAPYGPFPMEGAVVDSKLGMLEKLMEKLQAQNKEVIGNLTDSVQNVANVVNNLTNVSNQLFGHKSDGDEGKACEYEFQKPQNRRTKRWYVLQKKLIHKLDAQATKVQLLVESISNLGIITDNLLAGQVEIRKELTSVKSELRHFIDNVFPSCSTINETGTYSIRPAGTVEPFLVRCEFEDKYNLGGGWTVFQHRFYGLESFNRPWKMYKEGFGDVNGEHWLGLDKLHLLTRSGRHELLVLLEDHEGESAYALYDYFKVESEADRYRLTVLNYSGTAGDSLDYHNKFVFSTSDKSRGDCANKWGGGWWFDNCYNSHLNGKYHQKGAHLTEGVTWSTWRDNKYSLKKTKMLLRRRLG